MIFLDKWEQAVEKAGIPLCVGLDPLLAKLPLHLDASPSGVWHFLEAIIHTTSDLTAAYKPNLAFFEALGAAGWSLLERLREILPPHTLLIADGKFGDIPSTNEQYSDVVFNRIHADAVTVNPYLGGDALAPFLNDRTRGVFVVCATSNPGADEVQELTTNGRLLYEEIAHRAKAWNENENIGLVVGTTRPEALENILNIAPELPLLLPGSGAQGGSAKMAAKRIAENPLSRGMFVWARSILYASSGKDFADAARDAAIKCQKELI